MNVMEFAVYTHFVFEVKRRGGFDISHGVTLCNTRGPFTIHSRAALGFERLKRSNYNLHLDIVTSMKRMISHRLSIACGSLDRRSSTAHS